MSRVPPPPEESLRPGPARRERASLRQLHVLKRVVPVRVLLADGTARDGHFYADTQRLDGTPATIVDRLEDVHENYLPLATGNSHLLLNKSGIVTIELPPTEVPEPATEGMVQLSVDVLFWSGVAIPGTIHVVLPPAQSRALDYLNRSTSRFFSMFADDRALLVNRNYVIGVEERLGRL